MTRRNPTFRHFSLMAALLLPTTASSANAADIGLESITLEQIGAVRVVAPREFQAQRQQQRSSEPSRDQSSKRTSH